MRIVMLIENTAVSQKLLVEHGLAVFVEIGDFKVLFGAGGGTKLVNNAKRMKLPINSVSDIVIPHNHFAYTGGIDIMMQINPQLRIFAPAAANCRAVAKSGFVRSPSGDLPDKIKKYGKNFILFEKFQQVCDGFFLLTDEIGDKRFYSTGKNFYVKTDDGAEEMDACHECFAALFPYPDEKERGCVILGGCAHCGLPNMIRTVRKNWGEIPILSVISGLHFMGSNTKKLSADVSFIEQVAEEISELNVGMVYTCHCTGLKGYEIMKEKMGNQLQYLQTGEELNF